MRVGRVKLLQSCLVESELHLEFQQYFAKHARMFQTIDMEYCDDVQDVQLQRLRISCA